VKIKLSSLVINTIAFVLGFLSLLSPFLFQWARESGGQSATFPMVITLIIILCLFIIFLDVQSSKLDAKMIAFLGTLIAINAGLRFLENAIPGPAGFSPTFLLII